MADGRDGGQTGEIWGHKQIVVSAKQTLKQNSTGLFRIFSLFPVVVGLLDK
jgi:hypothetical protein